MLDDLDPSLANLAQETPQEGAVAITKALSEYETEDVQWLWHPYLPIGKLVIIEGHPSLGKSTLTCEIASIATRGRAYPCGTSNQPMNVLMVAVEDAPSDTIKPRVLASNGDVDRIRFLEGIKFPMTLGELTTDLSKQSHIEAIRNAIQEHQIGIVIIDPLMGLVGDSRDTHKDQSMRQITTPLTKLAQEEKVTIILVRHLTKGGGNQAILRGGGSIAIAGSARVVMLIAKDPQDEQKRVLAMVKNNLAPFQPSLSFHIVNDVTNKAGRIEWLGESQLSADDLLQVPIGEDKTAIDEAKDFLKAELADGAKSFKAIEANSRECGISPRTLERAKKELKIESKKSKSALGSGWNWHLPSHHYANDPLQ
jgi:archaellum biogenesis ATPase FlaH